MKRNMLLYMLEADVGAPVKLGDVVQVNGRKMKVTFIYREDNKVTLED